MFRRILLIVLCSVSSLHAGSNKAPTSSWINPKTALSIGCACGVAVLLANECIIIPHYKRINKELEEQKASRRTRPIRFRSDLEDINERIISYNSERYNERSDLIDTSQAFRKLNARVQSNLAISRRILNPATVGLVCGIFLTGVHQTASWVESMWRSSK